MRYYLDTNILFYMLQRNEDRIDRETHNIISDYANQMHTSVLCVAELMQLVITRLKPKHKRNESTFVEEWLAYNNITIEYISPKHFQTFEALPLFDNHHDVVDRLIIAQAISDKVTLVSSDLKFSQYTKYGLKLHQNKP
ncbi:MAG: PIN domain-containing protein [Prevotella sp.]|nr:PIN domain-containing protein [Prevotella sp.]